MQQREAEPAGLGSERCRLGSLFFVFGARPQVWGCRGLGLSLAGEREVDAKHPPPHSKSTSFNLSPRYKLNERAMI